VTARSGESEAARLGIVHPPIRGLRDIEALEAVPFESRIRTWDVNDWIRRGMSLAPEKIAYHCLRDADPDEIPVSVSYAELQHRSTQAANLFHSMGVGPQDAVLLLMPTIAQLFPAQYGALASGIACCLNWMLKPLQLAELIRATRCKVLVALGPAPGYEIWENLESIRERLPAGLRVLSVHALGGRKMPESDFETLCSRQPGERLVFERSVRRDDIAAYVHSGGTTGLPKLVKLTHGAFAFRCWCNPLISGYGPEDTHFSLSTLFHVTGFVTNGFLPAACAMTMVIPSPVNAREKQFVPNYWKLVERYRITRLSAAPPTMSLLAQHPPRNEDVSSLGPYTAVGGSPTPAEIARRIQAMLGIRLLNTYGATEYGQNCMHAPRDGDPRYGSSGIRLPYMQVKAVKLDSGGEIERECDIGEPGVLVVKGPPVTPGYLDSRHNVNAFTREGWFKSRDMGRFDAEGYLWITGRITDLIIRGGHNIEPSVIEEPLQEHPQVVLAAAVGKPDAYAGELPIAYVQLVKGATVTGPELAAFAAARVAERAAAPKEVHILDAIPLTDVGKPHKVKLRHDAAQRTFLAVLREALGEEVQFDVEVGDDETHGTVATITIPALAPRAIEDKIHRVMKAYAVHYDVRVA
jgi:fatty-acyl-CoA synthase